MPDLNDQEKQDLRLLLALLDKIDPWIKAMSADDGDPSRACAIQARSPLFGDDRHTHPYRVSHRVWQALSVAVDFLNCLRRSLIQELNETHIEVRIHSYAQMALIRGAVENASFAVALLGPSRIERITNRLGLEWKELAPSYRLRALLGNQPARTIDERRQQLVDLQVDAHQSVKSNTVDATTARKALRNVDYVALVQRAGELTPHVGATLAEIVWRMCSGLAHGDTGATFGILDKRLVQQVQPGVNIMEISADVRIMYIATLVAYLLTEQAFELFEARSRAPY